MKTHSFKSKVPKRKRGKVLLPKYKKKICFFDKWLLKKVKPFCLFSDMLPRLPGATVKFRRYHQET